MIPKVEFHFCCAGKSLDPFMKLELEDVVIGSHLTQAPHGGLPLEQMTLHCRQLTRLSTFADANNVKKQVAVGYDAMRQVSL